MKKQTQAIHLAYERRDAYDSLSVPVYNTLAYEFDNAQIMSEAFTDKIKAPDYSRVENPTVTNFERRVAALTGAHHATAFNSGMAAISNTFLALAAQGKNIVTSKHLFGNTYALLLGTLRRFGVKVHLCDLTNIDEVKAALDENSCCIFLEIITNPQMEVADLQALSAAAHEKNIPLVADTTAIPFTQFSAKDLGVDIEVVSSSKYVSGGATSLGGVVIDYTTEYCGDFGKKLYGEMLFNFGAYMTPQVAYMQTIGLETLDARYRVQSSNALELAKKLQKLPQIKRVGKHDLCHRASAVGRHIGHHHAMLARRVEVDDIVACGNHADIFEVGECFNHFAAHHHLVGENDLRVGSACDHFVGRSAVVHSALAQCFKRCPTQVARIAGKAVEHHDFHFFVHFTTVFWLEQS